MVRTENYNYNKDAKEYDKTGEWAIQGMDSYIASYFGIRYSDDNGMDAVQYITETYLECIESVSFKKWIHTGNEDGKVMILKENEFKYKYSEIFQISESLQDAIENIEMLYGCEWWMFANYEFETVYLATTYYKDTYNKLNITEVDKIMASFSTLLDLGAVTQERRDIFIEKINKATNNFFDNYRINVMSNDELFDEVDYRLGLGYLSGRYTKWSIIGGEKK